jgi:hypothetical protein
MPLQATSGAASYDAFGGGVPAAPPTYIEDVMSTWLYTGNGSTQTITNGIDLSTKGGLVWIKSRNAVEGHTLFDTARGVNQLLQTQNTDASANFNNSLTAFNTNGFSLGTNRTDPSVNYASWTFREQPKFFDVVTYTGTGSNATISHNLGSEPGCIIVKRTDAAGQNWYVYHRGASTGNKYLILNSTAAEDSGFFWTPTSTTFNVSSTLGLTANGGTYVCYLFAHNAGGFGLTGTDNVISCGSYTGNGSTSGPVVTLGYEPQWLLVKNVSTTGNWFLMDNMRGIPMTGDTAILKANTSAAEDNNQGHAIELNATGFQVTTSFTGTNGSGNTLIYIAIRRGPMKVPTTGTSVFIPTNVSSSGTFTSTANFPIDLIFYGSKSATDKWYWFDRLRGTGALASNNTSAEAVGYPTNFASNVNFQQTGITGDFSDYISYDLRRAPSFFDEVCYTGTGSARTVSHNLAVVPELMIVKSRSLGSTNWSTYVSSGGGTKFMRLDSTLALTTATAIWNDTNPTSSVFTVGTHASTNQSAETYVAYLFATCAGVSKVGSYTGTASTLQIDCGFTGGARFVLIKRTDSTGDWYVWDTARGIVSGNDPYLLLNSTAAEVTSTDYIDTYSAGFEISSTAPAAINASGGNFVFLAIA